MKQVVIRNYLLYVFSFLCTVITHVAWGQTAAKPEAKSVISQPARLELEANSFNDEFEIIPLPDSSLLVYKFPYSGSYRDEHQFQKYNRNLELLWTADVDMDDEQVFHKMVVHRDFSYVMYKSYRPTEFFILKIDNRTGANSFTKHDIKELDLFFDTQLDEFQVLQDQVFILAQSSRNLFVLHLDLKTKEIKSIPALFDQPQALSSYQLDTVSNRGEFVYSESNGIKGRLQIKRISPDGRLMSTQFIQPTTRRNLIEAKLTPGDSLSKVLVGTYAIRDFQMAQGFFTAPMATAEAAQQFYEFTDLKHFFDYLGKRGQHRIYRKAERFKRQEKEFKLRYRLALNELLVHRDTLYLFAEAYSPRYDEDPLMASIRSIPRRSFAGYRYSHSFVCAFNKKGELLWDNSYTLKDAETNQLAQVAQHGFSRDKIILGYVYKADIRYKIIDHSKDSDNTLTEPISAGAETTKIVSTEESDFKHWYANNFIAFGFQRIRPAGSSAKEVFFINKVSFKPQDIPAP